ncbi:MAG: GH92 family glycosyl hydrolase [Ignavibacteria bacterium]|jgi:predicted alpha-1,2-mannosidase
MKLKLFLFIVLISITSGCNLKTGEIPKEKDFTEFVDPIIGTSASTVPGKFTQRNRGELDAKTQPNVTVPFGMTNWTPQTDNTENKCNPAYYYKDTVITGFRGSHWLSGSCVSDYGTFAVMPVTGKLICNPWKRGSEFSHEKEVSSPNYYEVELEDYDVTVEMTATTRCGILCFTFNKEGDAHIVINPNSDQGAGYIKIIPGSNEIVGYNPVHRIYQGWGKTAGFSGHFVMKIDKAVENYGVYTEDEIYQELLTIKNVPNLGAYLSFKVKRGEKVKVKIGTSFVSIDQARKNLTAEIPGYDFDSVNQNLKNTWNDLLSRIDVESDNKNDKVKFYTAMYHCFQQPRIYNDVDGQYPRFDGNTKTDTITNGNYYCDFSVWDTYRALHALYNILIPEYHKDMVRSLLTMAKAGGWLPVFPLWNSYTSAMIGDHVTSIVGEAYIKGVVDLTEEDYLYLKKNANESPDDSQDYLDGKGRRALKSYLKYGYIPLEDSVKEAFHHCEQVSRTLEYAYDDFALAQIAKHMNKNDDYNYFIKRSQNFRNVFDAAYNNVNGRYKDGTFVENMNKEVRASFITEGTPWQYNWYVPHDVEALINLMGGQRLFNNSLDDFFFANQYWHGNEPSHHIPYLYNYSGEPWKTQKIVANTMKEEYGLGPGGLSGNDDAGQMSAWYVLGAVGFYPVAPVLPKYQICGPKFKKIVITSPLMKELVITAQNYSSENIYIRDITLNDIKHHALFLTHEEIARGGKLTFDMGAVPLKK